MEKVVKNAFLPDFGLNFTYANFVEFFERGASPDPLKHYFGQKTRKDHQKYFCPPFCMKCSHCASE
jgi:hypothetical protein